MTDTASAPSRLRQRLGQRLGSARVWVNLAGVALVAWGAIATPADRTPALAIPLAVVALGAWTAWALLPRGPGRVQTLALAIGGLAASVGTGIGASILIAVVIAAVITIVGDPLQPARTTAVVVAACVLALGVAAAAHRAEASTLLSVCGGVTIAVLAAVTRRQSRTGALREQQLQQRAIETEREAERARLLAERSAVARDIHDVLAHSLGGLVLQLDAIDALLEHGDTQEAAARVAQAHRLAADGLAEARRAVAALRDPGAGRTQRTGADALAPLVDTHRALGARAEVEGDLSLAPLDDAHRLALVRALQEALSNARRHAPGAVSRIRAVRDGGLLTLTVSTPISADPASGPGGGNGLLGMRERFAALGDASTVTAGRQGDRFVVDATVALR